MIFDPVYFLFVGPALALSLWASFRTKSAFKKYSQVRTLSGLTGAQAAGVLLERAGIADVKIVQARGVLSDHYNPLNKTLALSEPVYGSIVHSQTPIDEETKKETLAAIERYVKKDIELKQSFLIVDPRTGEPLRLTFDYVHQGVKPHAKGYLACVDFKDAAGSAYDDVDVVVARSGSEMTVQEVFLHKVDGTPVPKGWLSSTLNTLSPHNIARIEVLRDASVTSIYGLRGANGVVLITTKLPR